MARIPLSEMTDEEREKVRKQNLKAKMRARGIAKRRRVRVALYTKFVTGKRFSPASHSHRSYPLGLSGFI